jgi:hypothetical protein
MEGTHAEFSHPPHHRRVGFPAALAHRTARGGMSAPPVGTRFALRACQDGTVLCIVRSDTRHYTFERRDETGQWRRIGYWATSLSDALAEVERLAALDDEQWRRSIR